MDNPASLPSAAAAGELPDARTPPPHFRVPYGRAAEYYYAGVQRLHRIQAARGHRVRDHEGVWNTGLRILLYHRVSDEPDRLAVTPTAFRAQMELLTRANVNFVSLEEAAVRLAEGSCGRDLSVTFDDGYRDTLHHALPVLRELGIPATIFAVTGVLEGTARLYWYEKAPPTLSWSDLESINREALFSIGSHTRTHPALTKLPDAAAWEEIAGSRGELERGLGTPVTSFAYPAGLQSDREIRMVDKAGYQIGLTCEHGVNPPGQRTAALRRTYVGPRDDLMMFDAKLIGLLDRPWALRDAVRRRRRP